MDIQKSNFLSIDQLANQIYEKIPKTAQNTGETAISFREILEAKTANESSLKLSKHAEGRLNDRGIELTGEQWERLEGGARKAKQKGIKDSLVIVDDLAFIVNVPNQTIVTAMDSTQTDENVFTNINGAVIM